MVGTNAAQMALGMGANVTIVDKNVDRLRYLDQVLHGRIHTLASNARNLHELIARGGSGDRRRAAAGAKAPKLVTREMVAAMKTGSVVVDVAIDQGGCFETSKPTSHSDPVYDVDGVIHYCVTNMPGAVARTSTLALSNVTLPYGLALADYGPRGCGTGISGACQGHQRPQWHCDVPGRRRRVWSAISAMGRRCLI